MMASVIPARGHALQRVLGMRDLVLLNVAAIVALRWLSTAAQIGPSSLVMWLCGLVGFFIPLSLVVLDLGARMPAEGGLYVWTKTAFGDMHGFVAGWTYWISNIVYFPAVLLFGAGIFLHVGGAAWLTRASDPIYNGAFGLVVVWGATLLNIVGLERAKWIQNVGGAATWTAAVMIIGAGALAYAKFGTATPITMSNVWPDFTGLATLSTFATIAFAYSGLELGAIVGGEIRDPARSIPRAVLISGVVIAAIYISATASLLIALPAATIDAIAGIPQALGAIGERIGMPSFGRVVAFVVALGAIGSVSAYITCTARLPFVVGVDRHLPRAMGRLHPRFGTPYVALLVQAVLTTLILVASLSGSTIHEAFALLVDMMVILGLLPLLYVFAAYPVLRRALRGSDASASLRDIGAGLAASLGFATTLLAVVTSTIPPADSAHPAWFVAKVVGGSVLIVGVGLVFYVQNRERGTGNREQGTGNREQGTGNREQGTGNREQGTGNRIAIGD
jgi:amino acid transporter